MYVYFKRTLSNVYNELLFVLTKCLVNTLTSKFYLVAAYGEYKENFSVY